eukprot:501056-Pleurochrysis_carterae.AAC.1
MLIGKENSRLCHSALACSRSSHSRGRAKCGSHRRTASSSTGRSQAASGLKAANGGAPSVGTVFKTSYPFPSDSQVEACDDFRKKGAQCPHDPSAPKTRACHHQNDP